MLGDGKCHYGFNNFVLGFGDELVQLPNDLVILEAVLYLLVLVVAEDLLLELLVLLLEGLENMVKMLNLGLEVLFFPVLDTLLVVLLLSNYTNHPQADYPITSYTSRDTSYAQGTT